MKVMNHRFFRAGRGVADGDIFCSLWHPRTRLIVGLPVSSIDVMIFGILIQHLACLQVGSVCGGRYSGGGRYSL